MDSAERQNARDREYLAACERLGITPDIPTYSHLHGDGEALEKIASCRASTLDRPDDGSGFQFFDDPDEPDRPDRLPDEALTVLERLIELLLPAGIHGTAAEVRTAGIRVLVLAWMLGRGAHASRPLAAIADEIGCTRACLSWHARRIEVATGVHCRGQKGTHAVATYRASALAAHRANPRPRTADGERHARARAARLAKMAG
jgi:hypothetical protein